MAIVFKNLSSGGFLQEVESQIMTLLNEEKAKFTPSYNKIYDITENVTIYTPSEECKYYYICSNTSGFRILWFVENIIVTENLKIYPYTNTSIKPTSISISANSFLANGELEVTNTTSEISKLIYYHEYEYFFDFGYHSQYYSTIEECIEALKSNTTTYTRSTGSAFGATIYANKTPVIVTNGIELLANNLNVENEINNCARQLSSNETIVVIE